MDDHANDSRRSIGAFGALTRDEARDIVDELLTLRALDRLALLDGPENDRLREKNASMLEKTLLQQESSAALNRVLARILEGGSSFVTEPLLREVLIDLLRGKTEFKLVLQRRQAGRKSNSRRLALEVAFFVRLRTEEGRKQESVIEAAMSVFGLKRRRVFELLKLGQRMHQGSTYERYQNGKLEKL